MNRELIARLRLRLVERAQQRAQRCSEIALEEHRNAPRGGTNTNRFGQPRSAPGEAPATEFGRLSAALRSQNTANGARAAVNRLNLEWGYTDSSKEVLPRPLGRIALERLKGEVGR